MRPETNGEGRYPTFKHGTFLFHLSADDGADCISNISLLCNPKEDRQKATLGGLRLRWTD